MSSLHSIEAMNQLADALDAAGFTTDDVTKMRQYKELAKIKQILLGHAEIKMIEHLIDCDANPFVPNGLEVSDHKRCGQFKWNPDNILLYLSKHQKKGSVEGNKLRKELANKDVLNANVLDYLLAHPELIPEEWKGKLIFFWGTIYRDSDGRLYVRYLRWGGSRWNSGYGWLDNGFYSGNPAASHAS